MLMPGQERYKPTVGVEEFKTTKDTLEHEAKRVIIPAVE
jgi:hypothetical protein